MERKKHPIKDVSRSGESVTVLKGLTTAAACWAICASLAWCPAAISAEKEIVPMPARPNSFTQVGMASFYSHSGRTASGGKADPKTLSAAHRHLPFGSRATVTHLKSGKQVIVVINDRGPFRKGRIIDLSLRAAKELGITKYGVARVRVTAID
jgi:rare lipoprotein A